MAESDKDNPLKLSKKELKQGEAAAPKPKRRDAMLLQTSGMGNAASNSMLKQIGNE